MFIVIKMFCVFFSTEESAERVMLDPTSRENPQFKDLQKVTLYNWLIIIIDIFASSTGIYMTCVEGVKIDFCQGVRVFEHVYSSSLVKAVNCIIA